MNNLSPLGLITCFVISMAFNGASVESHRISAEIDDGAYIVNKSNHVIYFKPESRKANPGLDPYGAYELQPGEKYYLPFDAIVTSATEGGKIYRVPTGSRLIINEDGTPAPANFIARTAVLLPVYGNVNSPCVQFAKLANPKGVLLQLPDLSSTK